MTLALEQQGSSMELLRDSVKEWLKVQKLYQEVVPVTNVSDEEILSAKLELKIEGYGTPTCQDQKSSCLRCYPVALSNPLSVPATLRVA